MGYAEDQIRDAISLINSLGIGTYVPGCFNVGPEDGALYTRDRKAFYARKKEECKREFFEQARIDAEEKGVSFEEYCHYLRYKYCPMNTQPNGPYFDTEGWYETCSRKDTKGRKCKNPIRFHGRFEDFKPGISDRCKWHKEKG